LILIGIQGLTPFRFVGFPQHFCLSLHPVSFIITQFLSLYSLTLAVNRCLSNRLSRHRILRRDSGFADNRNLGCGYLLPGPFVRIIIDIIIFRCSTVFG
jgi:hypothetical protein